MRVIIPASVLDSCLEGARNSMPCEFLALLSGGLSASEAVVESVYLAPLAESDEGSVFFSDWHVPLGLKVIGSFHSHPRGAALPSRQDLRAFGNEGGVHLVACSPFRRGDAAAFDSRGRKLELKIV
ncbi:MAG: Mov34/MPN/PAD-1 family protein [Candidatus Micrarchaeota archaeon]